MAYIYIQSRKYPGTFGNHRIRNAAGIRTPEPKRVTAGQNTCEIEVTRSVRSHGLAKSRHIDSISQGKRNRGAPRGKIREAGDPAANVVARAAHQCDVDARQILSRRYLNWRGIIQSQRSRIERADKFQLRCIALCRRRVRSSTPPSAESSITHQTRSRNQIVGARFEVRQAVLAGVTRTRASCLPHLWTAAKIPHRESTHCRACHRLAIAIQHLSCNHRGGSKWKENTADLLPFRHTDRGRAPRTRPVRNEAVMVRQQDVAAWHHIFEMKTSVKLCGNRMLHSEPHARPGNHRHKPHARAANAFSGLLVMTRPSTVPSGRPLGAVCCVAGVCAHTAAKRR